MMGKISALLVSVSMVALANAARADVEISNKPTANMSCDAGVCSPTAKKANLNVTDLTNLLAFGDTKVVSDSATKDIDFKAPLSWASTSRLTLGSYRSINFQQPITVVGTGALTITTNGGGSEGDFVFKNKGQLSFWDLASKLHINRESYVLVGSILNLAEAIYSKPSGRYAMASNYDASADGTYSSAPIATEFRGRFEGLGHTISNLNMNDPSTANTPMDGLFAETKGSATIRDVTLAKANLTGGLNGWIGGLVGRNYGTITRAVVTGSLSGGDLAVTVGGIAGENDGTIAGSSFSGSVYGKRGFVGGITGNNYYGKIIRDTTSGKVVQASDDAEGTDLEVGGLVGSNYAGYITDSHSTTRISVNRWDTVAGGLVGGSSGTITRAYAKGDVTVSVARGESGGLVGFNNGTITQSFATGSVIVTDQQDGHGGANVGGFVGDNDAGGLISDCYELGAASARNGEIGGFVGDGGYIYLNATVNNAYSIGAVSGGEGLNSWLGGFAGFGDLQLYDFWDVDTSGVTDPAKGCGNAPNCHGVTGVADADLKSKLPNGFDAKIWGQSPKINSGYPYLLANPPAK